MAIGTSPFCTFDGIKRSAAQAFGAALDEFCHVENHGQGDLQDHHNAQ